MANGQDYWKAAATLKRTAAQLKGLVPEVRRLDAIHDPAKRRDAKLTMAAALGRLGQRRFIVGSEMIDGTEIDPETVALWKRLKEAAALADDGR